MVSKLVVLAPPMLLLMACDAATEIAGDTLQAEMQRGVVAQCEQVAEGAGIAASRVSAVCQCAAGKLKADTTLTLPDLSRERVQGIVETCVAETDPDGVGR